MKPDLLSDGLEESEVEHICTWASAGQCRLHPWRTLLVPRSTWGLLSASLGLPDWTQQVNEKYTWLKSRDSFWKPKLLTPGLSVGRCPDWRC